MRVWSDRISAEELKQLVGGPGAPRIVDVRRAAARSASGRAIPASSARVPESLAAWQSTCPRGAPLVVYCAHGHNVSEMIAATLRCDGVQATVLEGGIDAWIAAGGATVRSDAIAAAPGVWITRARPKVDRIACPWLVRRFVDPEARFLFVASEWVRDVAEETGAIPFDIPETRFSHVGELCSFDAFLREFDIHDPALDVLAPIVRGADTGRLDLAPECAGLLAAALGGSAMFADDLAQLEHGFAVYDALYAWAAHARGERHNWKPSP